MGWGMSHVARGLPKRCEVPFSRVVGEGIVQCGQLTFGRSHHPTVPLPDWALYSHLVSHLRKCLYNCYLTASLR